jgi:hypothetical protein
MNYSDLLELKAVLEVDPDNPAENKKFGILIEWASRYIDEFRGTPGPPELKSRTEYYNGTGTQKLLLRQRPVFVTTAPAVVIDSGGYWGQASGSFAADSATTLTFGEDFAIQIDQDDGSSRCGIMLRINNYWPRPGARQAGMLAPFMVGGFGNVRVTYTAGFTVDSLPSGFRTACNLLVAAMRYVFPLGMPLNSESYEERSIGIASEKKDYLTGLIRPYLWPYRNWKW